MQTVLFIGAHNEEIECECPILPMKLAAKGLRVLILNPVGGPNWTAVRRAGEGAYEKVTADCVRAAEALGCEKVIWDYPCADVKRHRGEIQSRMAELYAEISPMFAFIHWPHDTHADHREIADISFHILHRAPNLIEDPFHKFNLKEAYDFQAGFTQTYDFWPDFLVLAGEDEIEKAKCAIQCFKTYGAEKCRIWSDNVQGKLAYWEQVGGHGPAEAYKYLGPTTPAHGLRLAEVLGDEMTPVTCERWQFPYGAGL